MGGYTIADALIHPKIWGEMRKFKFHDCVLNVRRPFPTDLKMRIMNRPLEVH